ncbi:glycosyltransferase [Fibrella sp. HMF5335]|uniref:Glycosyltransferase n=1 Tax=Fibrella rubiginis TaxID=2817060 RepID=A0A939GHX4_9BACT|nr:glycosyltransferase [Fibrella rubiginis]MBO0937086.1 glycosyltransferase [Fibrella rubiginis]
MDPYFTVVLPTTQSDQLTQCLHALHAQTLSPDQFEIVVVDDRNQPETAAAVAAFSRESRMEIRYLAQASRQGLSAARNRGWRAARGQFIAFTDADCLPQPTWLAAAQGMFRRGAQVVTGSVRVVAPRQPGQPRPQTVPDITELSTANCFCQKMALQRAGGFEETFDLAWREDLDLQFKFLEIGIPILRCPEAVVVQPMRPMSWYASLNNERKNRYDALLYKRHPELVRQRVHRSEAQVARQYLTVTGLVVALLSAAVGYWPVALLGLAVWLFCTGLSLSEEWSDQVDLLTNAKHAGATSVASPFLSVYWRLYGAVKYRVLYF